MGSFYSTTAGDTAPPLRTLLTNAAGEPQGFGGATIHRQIHRYGEQEVTPTATPGEVEGALPAAITPGIHHMKHRVTFADGSQTSFPQDDHDVLEVLPAPVVPAP